MSQKQDFLDEFSGIIVVAVAVLILLFLALQFVGGGAAQPLSSLQVQQTAERIKPVGQVATKSADAKASVAVEKKPLTGEEVYNTVCTACHGLGVAGAPKFGDKAAWEARIAQGADTLVKHAIEGYQGKAGVMPAKGGNADLSDAEVKAAIEYMVAAAKGTAAAAPAAEAAPAPAPTPAPEAVAPAQAPAAEAAPSAAEHK